jgi:ADP-heptose:LPS heptosyltransferase
VTPVLVARLDSVGDVLLAGPAIRAVAHGRRPDGGEPNDVVLLCGPQGEPAAALLPGITEVYSWSCPWIVKPAPPVEQQQLDALQKFVRNSRITEAVILTSFHQSPLPLALQLRLAGVRRITGVSTDYAGPQPDVVVHPGSSAAARAWPALHHAAAVELLEGAGHRVVVTGGPKETKLTATVAGPSAVDLGGRTDLKTLAGVLAHAEVLITGNTGPAHLAAALGTPVACLFSPVVPAIRWAPYGVPLELLGDQAAPCRLTRATECPVPGHPCLSSVGPEQLVEAVERLISGVTSLSTRRKVRHP